MKELAIITLYDDVNLGNKLQNYALEKTLTDMGFQTASVVCSEILYSLRQFPWKRRLKIRLLPKLRRKQRLFELRRLRFREFSERHLTVGETVSFRDRIQPSLEHYDYFVAGSDQVWHNWRENEAELRYFFLQFAPEQKRVCYAPSFGFDQVPEKFQKVYTEGLMGFEELCCRERSGCELIRRLTGREAELVCDPTLLLDTRDWDRIARKPDYDVPEKFMLVYFLGGEDQQVRQQIRRIAEDKGLAVIDLYSGEVSEHYLTTPDEFLYLMARASYVFTDSFHGSVFASLYHRPFHVHSRKDAGGARMGNRICTLLEQLGITMEETAGAGSEGFWQENFSRADAAVKTLRACAHAYLERALRK